MTASVMPTAIADVNGERLYAWVVTLFLGGSVLSGATAFWVLRHNGARRSYLIGSAIIAVGSIMCAVAPNTAFLVAGRAVQGVAGGLLAGIGYATIRASLPKVLWARMAALLSVIVGLQVFIAPAIGGLFVRFAEWRWAYAVTVVLAGALAILVQTAFDGTSVDEGIIEHESRIPLRSLLLIAASMVAVNLAHIPGNGMIRTAFLLAAAVLVVAFVAVDRRSVETVLPPSTFSSPSLKWAYITIAFLMAALMVDAYVPLFGQRLSNLTPATAGILGGALTLGWVGSQVVSASLINQRAITYVVVAGPVTMLAGLLLTAAHCGCSSVRDTTLWALGLLLIGVGYGSAYPHLLVQVMGAVDGPAESRQASIAINIVAQFAAALAVGVAGVVDLTTGDTFVAGDLKSAPWLFIVFIVPAIGAVLAAYRATHLKRSQGPGTPTETDEAKSALVLRTRSIRDLTIEDRRRDNSGKD